MLSRMLPDVGAGRRVPQRFSFQSVPAGEPGKNAVKSIITTPCTSEPCRLKKGTDVFYEFKFIGDEVWNEPIFNNSVFARGKLHDLISQPKYCGVHLAG